MVVSATVEGVNGRAGHLDVRAHFLLEGEHVHSLVLTDTGTMGGTQLNHQLISLLQYYDFSAVSLQIRITCLRVGHFTGWHLLRDLHSTRKWNLQHQHRCN